MITETIVNIASYMCMACCVLVAVTILIDIHTHMKMKKVMKDVQVFFNNQAEINKKNAELIKELSKALEETSKISLLVVKKYNELLDNMKK